MYGRQYTRDAGGESCRRRRHRDEVCYRCIRQRLLQRSGVKDSWVEWLGRVVLVLGLIMTRVRLRVER